MALGLSIITLLFVLFSMGDYHKAAEVTMPEMAIALAALPMQCLAFGLVIYGCIQWVASKRLKGYFAGVVLCALPLPVLTVVGLIHAQSVSARAMVFAKWAPNAPKIADLFVDFYHLHPDQIKRLKGEEVEPIDFMIFCQARSEFQELAIPHDALHFLDFDGKPVRYYIDFDRNGVAGINLVVAGGVAVTDSGTTKGTIAGNGNEEPQFVDSGVSPREADATAALFLEYYQKYPERIRVLHGEEVVPDDGFVPFCEERHLSMRIGPDPNPEHRPNFLVDISNQPIQYFIDLDRNGLAGPCPVAVGGVAILEDEMSYLTYERTKKSGLGTAPRNPRAEEQWAHSLRAEYLRTGKVLK